MSSPFAGGPRACLLAILALALCLPATAGADGGAPARAMIPTTGIAVEGAQLFNDGVPWIPRGVQIVGLVAPSGALHGKYVAASQHFGAAELTQARADGADLVRFQVSEFGLDPFSDLYSAAYRQQVVQAVQLARSLGLDVIISLQAQPPAGEPTRCPLPDAGAERAWLQLAPLFAGDPGVMLELYNEPGVAATAAGWQLWLNGGTLTESNGGSCQAIGMQTLIDAIRGQGADNVIIVPGLAGERTLAGMPPLVDPVNESDPQLAYGIHYPPPTGGVASWRHRFGAFAATHPVIVTEWNENAAPHCVPDAPAVAPSLLAYLVTRRIGVVGFAFDVPGTIVADWSYTPTSYSGFGCGVADGGPGQLLLGEFKALAQADGPQPTTLQIPRSDPMAWIVSNRALRRVAALSPALAIHLFDSPLTFVTGGRPPSLAAEGFPAALPAASFTSERALAAAVREGRLPAGTRAVLFDDRARPATPRAEQLHPAVYYRRAARVAHAHGLLLIAAPEIGLAGVKAPRTPPQRLNRRFLRLGIARAAARHADAYVIEAQDSEQSTGAYSMFVRAAAAQARAARPGIEVIGGLTTNPAGAAGSANALYGAVLETESAIAGYRLEDPGPRAHCSACARWYPQMALGLLAKLGG